MFKRIAAAAVATALSAFVTSQAMADPFSVTYTGTLGGSTIPTIKPGETYDVTFVLDNGSGTASSQTWTGGDLTCVVWRFNDARDVIYAQDLTASVPNVSDTAQTDASGVLTGMFSLVTSVFPQMGVAQSNSAGLLPDYAWFASGAGKIFYDSGTARDAEDASGGVQMAPVNWSAPQPFSGNCLDQVNLAPPPPAAVPTMGEWALILLGGLLAAAAATILGRRRLA